jgi:hypothetical protein
MEILLIDVGALGVFLGYVAIVYWHGVSHETQRAARKADRNCAGDRRRAVTS